MKKKDICHKIAESLAQWKQNILTTSLSKIPLRKARFATSSDITLEDLNVPNNTRWNQDYYLEKIGFPGSYPYTRGIHANMYRARPWTMRQYAGFGSAKETNARYQFLLSQGTTGLSVAFDLPTQMGRDSDHTLAQGEVGRVGVAIDNIHDMEALFENIPLDSVSTSMTINATAHILLALYLVVAKRRNISWNTLRGTVQNDILKEYIARGTYIYPPAAGLKLSCDIVEFCHQNVPKWNTMSISGYHIREAGAHAAQELAFTLANGICYVESLLQRGLSVDTFAPRLAFFFNCHNHFLEEIAKFRAARRMWARIMKERFNAQHPRSAMLRFHTQTAGSSLTAQEPLNNVVRTTTQALAAVLGGTQSLHTNSFDEALSLPSEESALLALRTQQIILEETGIGDVVDPFGGSYTIEALTDKIEQQAIEIINEIDAQGTMVEAIEQHIPQQAIEDSAFEYQKGLESNTIRIVGVNTHCNETQSTRHTSKQRTLKEERVAIRSLSKWKSSRDKETLTKALQKVKAAAQESQNIMPSVCNAVECEATVGEISDTLREVYGDYQP